MNLIRNVFGLMICLIMLDLALMSFVFVGDIEFDYDAINDDIAINQLRRILLISYDVNASADGMRFIYHNKEFHLNFVNNRLILQPGTQIFLNHIDEGTITTLNNCYVVKYMRKGKEYEKVLCSESGIYIDDCSDCDVLYDERGDGED